MYDQPVLIELLDAVRAHLETEIAPLLKDGEQRKRYYQTLVAVNVLRIAGRELTMSAEHLLAEWARLNYIQQLDTPLPADPPAARAELAERNRKLCMQINEGDFDRMPQKAALFEHLLATTIEQLQVANPRFLQALALEDADRERRR